MFKYIHKFVPSISNHPNPQCAFLITGCANALGKFLIGILISQSNDEREGTKFILLNGGKEMVI
jgi:hypothetical protein